jgi:MoxR-like ATPase
MTGVRASFEAADGLPPVGSRVCLSGFDRAAFDEAARLLALHGLKATSFVGGADAVLVPDNATPEVLNEARKSGRRVLLLDALRESTPTGQRRPALEITEDFVRVLDVTLERRREGERFVPATSRFAHLCLDASFLRAARAVAIAVRDGLPCALEGETATAKTTSVLWLASLCRQGVVRLNLNGQTDAGELVGRYVPASDWGEWDIALLDREQHLLEDQSRGIVRRALDEKRPLNWVERVALAANERLPTSSWRFWEGYVPQAMRHGYWVVLDEMNLAEPQVLERLNPVLESPPTLVLSEHDGTTFGQGGDVPVHPNFRIFGTMNPAEYSGRSILSPAFRDRWTVWSFVEPAGEGELRAMLRCLVHGEQPEFALGQGLWRAPDIEPVHPALARVPDIDSLLEGLASFHVAVSAASGGWGRAAEVGRARRERYVFTRRGLLAAVRAFAGGVERGTDGRVALLEAIDQLYIERVQPGPDRQAVRAALRAVGLGR